MRYPRPRPSCSRPGDLPRHATFGERSPRGETLARIFTNRITNWNDPQITEDNNGRQFPDPPIIPVVRADGSGTTALLTNWMDAEHPSVWRDYFGRSGRTSYYPVEGGRTEAASGSFQVMNEIRSYSR